MKMKWKIKNYHRFISIWIQYRFIRLSVHCAYTPRVNRIYLYPMSFYFGYYSVEMVDNIKANCAKFSRRARTIESKKKTIARSYINLEMFMLQRIDFFICKLLKYIMLCTHMLNVCICTDDIFIHVCWCE